MTRKQAAYDLVKFLHQLRHTEVYRERLWQLTPARWQQYNRAYDKWLVKQQGMMPVPRDFV